MFTKGINRKKMPILLGTTIALLATLGLTQEAKAQQQPVRSNIAPRPVRSNLVPTTNIRSNLLAPSVQDALNSLANDLDTTVDELLSNQQIAEIALSPSGAEVLNSLQEADGITGTEGNFTVDSNVPVATVETPQSVSVGTTLDILDSEE
ncbi:hypothetical protein Dacsa_0332 [Dactylococcopsis salina PCC 8305]|uniref:Uncharacterized protein n=2 Tax=Dactylococcopsis salina TaxID=292566 RepID=K9YQG2_DACS8|nr:hypothetical protein Dacsa_0332 [Dactylococcopsis salina PCC 8305]